MTAKLDNARGLYMEGIRDGKVREAVTKYTGDRYTQHSTGVADGVEGFVAFFEPFVKRCTERDIKVVRAIEDGKYVFTHASQNINGGESRWVTTDLFDTDSNHKIVEHWDVIEAWAEDSSDGRSQVGGPTEVVDLDQTESNKAKTREFIDRVLIGANYESITKFVSEDLSQHDLAIKSGSKAWIADLVKRRVRYKSIFRLIGQGNFVVSYCKVDIAGHPHAIFDIYRLDGGLIVERWTNSEIVPEDPGNSGKF